MGNKKIADSIIIRVGGGIREVPRAPAEIVESLESAHREAGFQETEDVRPFGGEPGSDPRTSADKIMN